VSSRGGPILAIAAFAFIGTPALAEAKPKMLVQDLVPQGVETHEAQVISTATCNAFSKAGKFDVLCGEDLRNMMRFGALAASFETCADASCYQSMGKAMQARFVVSGTVSKLGGTFVMSLSMIDTATARPIGRTELKAGSLEKLHAQASEAASAILTER
jgi:hypothetical protein